MNLSNSTGPTAAPSSTPSSSAPASSDQGSSPSKINPFEVSPPSDSFNSESSAPETPIVSETPAGEQGVAQPPGQQAAPAAPSFDPQQLTKSVVESVLAAQQAQQQQSQQSAAPTPMSPDEFRSHYQIPRIDAQTYEAILGVAPDKPERVAAFEQTMQGYMRAGLLMGQDLFKAQLAALETKLSGQVQPLLTSYQQQQETAIVNEFTSVNPDLKDYMTVVTEVRDAMIARGTKFSSKEEMFKQVGAKTREVINRLRPGGLAPGGQQQPGNQPPGGQQPKSRTMTPAAAGGRGGSAAPTKKSTAEAIFGG